MSDDLMRVRASFYRRFVVIASAAAGHLMIMLSCLALMLIAKTMVGTIGLFVVGHVVLVAAFHSAWTRLREQYPDTLPAAAVEASGDLEAGPPYDHRRVSAVRAFRKREVARV